MYSCKECNSNKVLTLKTYKRKWFICEDCGSGYPMQRECYPLQFIPCSTFKKKDINASQMYDYFIEQEHIKCSQNEVKLFQEKYVNSGLLDVHNKKILDISGGNGVFLSELVKMGSDGVLTEFNEKSVEFARANLNLKAVKYDLNQDNLENLVDEKFDFIFLRACLMFCEDLPRLLSSLSLLLQPGGKVFIQYAVYPTLGTLIRTQLDEFSYARLRSPQIIRENFIRAGFKEEYFEDEIDPTLYVYDHDKSNSWLFLHYLYEIPGVLKTRKNHAAALRARTRNRANFIFRL